MDAFSIQLYMKYPGLSTPRERDRGVMEIILDGDLSMEDIKASIGVGGRYSAYFCPTLSQLTEGI